MLMLGLSQMGWLSSQKLMLQNGSSQLVKLWGEDALLDWPGALDPVIHKRDAHMAKTIYAAAQGTSLTLSMRLLPCSLFCSSRNADCGRSVNTQASWLHDTSKSCISDFL